jgi:succinate-semialdehyde dehydrogenase/glutarate-semialdehyde dehydrogenase
MSLAEPIQFTLPDELGFEPRLWIGGRWVAARDGRTFAVRNPADDTVVAEVALAGESETRLAIEAAAAAFPEWSRTSVLARADLMLRLVELLREHAEPLARLAVLEQGAPLAMQRGSVDYAASFFRWFAEEARRIYGRTIDHPDTSRRLRVEYVPSGVAGLITPWNGPLATPAKKIAAALAAGCTVVAKPAELTPLSALALAWLMDEAGFPPGVLNVVCGDAPAIGQVLLEHEAVRVISFTGSTRVGRHLMSEAGKQIKRVALELGGNGPFIVFADAELDRAVADLLWMKSVNSGQVCVTANRVYVEETIREEFERRLADAYGRQRVGSGFDPAVQMGPLIHADAASRVDQLVSEAVEGGAIIRCGGTYEDGSAFYPPTVISNVNSDMRLVREEIFGPVLPIFGFRTEADVLRAANQTPYRLAAYFYTQNLQRAERVAAGLDFGVVGINDPRPITCEAPFGGIGQSGLGREGGREGIHDFLECKLVGLKL